MNKFEKVTPAEPVTPADSGRVQRWFLGLIAAAVVLVLLVQGRFFLIPLAIAILLFSLTSAIIDFIANLHIGRFRIPNWLASVAAVAMIAMGLLALFGILSAQIDTVVGSASNYTERGGEAVAALFTWFGDDISQAFLEAFEEIDLGSYIRAAAGSAGNLLLTTILVILYIGFLFAERPWFEVKVRRMFPDRERAEMVMEVVASIKRNVHHYVIVKTAVSAATALIVYGIMLAMGLDFAEPLAILTFVLNFIPNIGSMLATAAPTIVALVQFGDWTSVAIVFFSVGIVQFTIGNVIEPTLMGRTLSLSSFAIILSLTFWGAVWGGVGMFLAVPIMVMVMIVFSHIPALRPFAVMMSREGIPMDQGPERVEDEFSRSPRHAPPEP
jgi:AI-2 transport protein TqsA